MLKRPDDDRGRLVVTYKTTRNNSLDKKVLLRRYEMQCF